MKSTAKTVGLVMIIMLFSRLLAFVSTTVYITFFGVDNPEINIYSYAIQLPNVVFTILGTALTIAVIPVFAGYIGTGEKQRAFKFADNIISLSTIFTAVLSVLGIFIAPYILLLTRFKHEGYEFAVAALSIMFPVMIFYALNYVFQGILQSLGRFNMPAFVSIPSSLIVILYVFVFGSKFGVMGLLIATFIGLSLQALILIPPIYRTEYRFRLSFDYRNEDIKRALKLVPPVLLGTSAYQLNILFNITVTANFKNTVAIMAFVQNTILYSVLALIYSITAVVFPKLTMLAARGDIEGYKDNLLKVLKSVIYLLVPAAAGFIAVRYQLLNFIMGWGKITASNVSLASDILALYAVGITGIGIKEIVDRAFYSLNDTKKPAYNGVIIMVVNIAASLILIRFINVLGIPMAYSISALTGGFVILYMLRRKVRAFGGRKLLFMTVKVITASVIMVAVVTGFNSVLGRYTFGAAIVDRGLKLFIPAGAGAVVYFLVTYLLRVQEAVDVLNKVRLRFGRVL